MRRVMYVNSFLCSCFLPGAAERRRAACAGPCRSVARAGSGRAARFGRVRSRSGLFPVRRRRQEGSEPVGGRALPSAAWGGGERHALRAIYSGAHRHGSKPAERTHSSDAGLKHAEASARR